MSIRTARRARGKEGKERRSTTARQGSGKGRAAHRNGRPRGVARPAAKQAVIRPPVKAAVAKSASANGVRPVATPTLALSHRGLGTPLLRDALSVPLLPELRPGTAGDHPAIQHLLQAVFQAPSPDGFGSSIEDPLYEPCDRLVVSRGDAILAHLHLTPRTMHFDGLRLSVCGLGWLATLPECRGQGHASRLLEAATRSMAAEGAVLGLLRTRSPWFFRRAGWAVCGRHSHSTAGPRELLAQLSMAGLLGRLRIRPWRQVEMPALMRLYSRHAAGGCGAIDRGEAYWRWLLSRHEIDRIFVADAAGDKGGDDFDGKQVQGYCIMRHGQILELMHDPAAPEAAHELLARAAGEAIEHDLPEVTLFAPPDHALHGMFVEARGMHHQHEVCQGEVLMVQVLDAPRFLSSLVKLLHARAAAADLPRPTEFGLSVAGEKMHLAISRRSVKFTRGRLGRNYLVCKPAELTRLLLGHLDVAEAAAAGRLQFSTRLALTTACVLFRQRPLWRSPLDEV